MNQNLITLPVAVVMGGFFIALGLYLAAPRYSVVPISTSTNPAVWKLDLLNGNVFLCATGTGKDTQAGCTQKFKQF